MHTSALHAPIWVIDPEDPRAPPQEIWDRMSPEERAQVVDSLPSEFPVNEALPPQGDAHFEAKVGARNVLREYLQRLGRKVYIGSELPVYYPGEAMFAPDLIAVLGVEPHPRERWAVAAEGKGVDLAMEIHVHGDRRKDLERNMERYARLGIREYFIFDRGRLRLHSYRLSDHGPAQPAYLPIVPSDGVLSSQVLGLNLCIEGTELRFLQGTVPVPEAPELVRSLQGMFDDAEARRLEEAQKRAQAERELALEIDRRVRAETERVEEAQKRAEEAQKRAEAERKLAELQAELERSRRG